MFPGYLKKFTNNIPLLVLSSTLSAPSLLARNIYLNGKDISSAKNQIMENVTLQIDRYGNIYIEAPHYEVLEENTFIPLSQWKANQMQHKKGEGISEPKELKPIDAESKRPQDFKNKPGQKVQ